MLCKNNNDAVFHFSLVEESKSQAVSEDDWVEGLLKKQTTNHRNKKEYLNNFASNMRKEMTEAEKKIWYSINRKQLGCNFRRQFIIENKYIVDFICLEKKLIIEIDGGQHSENNKDIERDNFLKSKGFKILRLWNNGVLENIEGCKEQIEQTLHQNCDFTNRTILTPPQGRSEREKLC